MTASLDLVLMTPAKKVGNFRDPWVGAFLDRMRREVDDRDALGIAAPQLKVGRRMAVARLSSGVLELVNPEIVDAAGEQVAIEGCLSLTDEAYTVTRPTSVVVRYQDRAGRWRKLSASGRDARILSHELDHLRGVLISAIGTRVEIEPASATS